MCVQSAIGAGFTQQALDGEQAGPDVTKCRPLILGAIQAGTALGVHVGGKQGVRSLYPSLYCAGCPVHGPCPFEQVVIQGRRNFLCHQLLL